MNGEYDPVTSPQHYPLPMARFGANVYGNPLYRIVLASSIRKLVGGTWPDGETAYHWIPAYGRIKSAWILERWQMPRSTKAEWDRMVEPISGWLINGPYPARGEYYLAWEFDKGVDHENLDKIIGAIERGRNRSLQDLDDFNRAEYEGEDKDTRRNVYDEIRDAFTAYGGRAFASSRVARGTKTAARMISAEEAGLPIPRAGTSLPRRVTLRKTVDVRDIAVTNSIYAGHGDRSEVVRR